MEDITKVPDIWFAIGGLSLFPVKLKEEAFTGEHAGWHIAVGYTPDGCIKFVAKPNCSIYRIAQSLKNVGCVNGIMLDSGGSTNLWCEGKGIRQGRKLSTIITF